MKIGNLKKGISIILNKASYRLLKEGINICFQKGGDKYILTMWNEKRAKVGMTIKDTRSVENGI